LPAERIGFVSSNAWDAWAASACGFKTAWLNRARQKPERLPGGPAAEIARIDELAPLLGAS
jgi:2-haloacid dehalogenase